MSRPLATYILLAYCQEQFIREAVESALAQTYSPLEIIISDDRSPDGTYAEILRATQSYAGPHTLIVQQNSTNLGIGAHVSKLTAQASGSLVIVGAGDDVSLPERTERLMAAVVESGQTYAYAYSNALVVDEHGTSSGPFVKTHRDEHCTALWMAKHGGGAVGCSAAWTPALDQLFGPIPRGVIREDAVLPFRAALAGRFVYLPELLVRYRRHSGNVWTDASSRRSAEDEVAYLRKHAAGNLAVVDCRLADLAIAEREFATRRAEYAELRPLLIRARKFAQFELDMLEATGRRARIGLVAGALSSGVDRRAVAKWAAVFLWPRGYGQARSLARRWRARARKQSHSATELPQE